MRQTADIVKAERDLKQALQILAFGTDYSSEEWTLLATLLGDVDLVLRDAAPSDDSTLVQLCAEALKQLRAATSDFSDPAFLRATTAARRRHPRLFARGV